jgi:hypothetical protein
MLSLCETDFSVVPLQLSQRGMALHTHYCIAFQLSRKENNFFIDSVFVETNSAPTHSKGKSKIM